MDTNDGVSCVEGSPDDKQPSFDSNFPSDLSSGNIQRSGIKYASKKQVLKAILLDYSGKTSIHGVRYIFESGRPMCERVLWLIIFVSSLVVSCLVIHRVHVKWQESPVMVGFDETMIPIHKIPFPTITICPETRMKKDIFDFTEVYINLLNESAEFSDVELERLSAALHICDADLAAVMVEKFPHGSNVSVVKTLYDMALPKLLATPVCKWDHRVYTCENVLRAVATADGICYQFNGLRSEDMYRNKSYAPPVPDDVPVNFNKYGKRKPNDPWLEFQGSWTLEGGYVNQTKHSYPLRTGNPVDHASYSIVIQTFEHDFDFTCRGIRQGYKIFISTPGDVVSTSSKYILARHSRDVNIQIHPVYTTTSDTVREYTPKRRHCFFNRERYLRFFKHYSQINCQFECLANFTIARCGCVTFPMPQPDDVRVCNHADIACYTEARLKLDEIEILKMIENPSYESVCNCLPECVSLSYDLEMTYSYLDILGTLQAMKEQDNDITSDTLFTRLTIHFKQQQFSARKRSVLYSVSTLIANYGGVLSLFIGSSILSLVELAYFVTIRLKNTMRQRRV